MEEKKSILNALPAKQVFILGIVTAFFVLTSVGFFVLLAKQFTTDGTNEQAVKTAQNQQPNGQPSPTQPVPTNGEIVLPKFTGDEWYKGGKNAKVTIVEYSDTECPFCKRFHETMNQVIAEYGDKVKWVYRHAPLSSLHQKAQREAEATECAGELGGNDGFWNFTDKLFEITPSNDGLADSQLPQIAEEVGLNKAKFENCLNSGKYTAKVQEQLREAESAGLRGTPYSVVVSGDQKIPISGAQPYASVKQLIDIALKQ